MHVLQNQLQGVRGEKMVRLKINGRDVEVPEGATILEAAKNLI